MTTLTNVHPRQYIGDVSLKEEQGILWKGVQDFGNLAEQRDMLAPTCFPFDILHLEHLDVTQVRILPMEASWPAIVEIA